MDRFKRPALSFQSPPPASLSPVRKGPLDYMSRETKISSQALTATMREIIEMEAQITNLVAHTKSRLDCIFTHVDKYQPPTELPPEATGEAEVVGGIVQPQRTCKCGMLAPNLQNWQDCTLTDQELVVNGLRAAFAMVAGIEDDS